MASNNKKATPQKRSKANQNKDEPSSSATKRSWLRWCVNTFFKLSIVGVLALGLYAIYLDGKVRSTFEGQRWEVPVQVFGQVETLTRGDKLILSELKSTLLATGYERVDKVKEAGQFALSKSRVIIFQHDFDFGDGEEEAAKVTIDVANNQVTNLYLEQSPTQSIRLTPVFIDRILPESKEDRVLASLETVPQKLLDTLLLVEDRDFYFHKGVSITGIFRALVTNITAGRTVQGGSTLTQQLVKNMFLTREKTITRKVNEALMALILEYRYSKDQLLEAYINEVYLGQHYANGIYGFGLAADFYFGQSIEDLKPQQMALLIGQVKGPSYYDPWRFPERAKKRRNLVLRLMFEQNFISVNEFESAVESSLSVRKSRRMVKQKYPAYIQRVKAELSRILSETEQQSGIKVYTGFSLFSQQAAEQTVAKKLADLEKQHGENELEAAMIVTDVSSGEVRAVVGGREVGYAGFNRALHAKRPIGSLIKPAIFLAALERYEQFNFATVLDDAPITLTSEAGDEWRPKNYDGKYRESVNLHDALVESLNVPTVNLGMKIGLDNVASAIALLGYEEALVYRPSMLLGSINMSPWEINQLYVPLANKGDYQRAHVINKIVSPKGETLFEFTEPAEPRLSDNGAYLIDYALQHVTQRGTAKSLTWRLKNKKLAGKTGTTNDQRDSWFAGYDENLLVTTWLGRDDNRETKLTGSSGALVLFADFMSKQKIENIRPILPESIALQKFENKSGNAVNEDCLDTVEFPVVTSGLVVKSCLEKPEEKKSWFEKLFGNE